MGLLLSVLVVCVGLAELVALYLSFKYRFRNTVTSNQPITEQPTRKQQQQPPPTIQVEDGKPSPDLILEVNLRKHRRPASTSSRRFLVSERSDSSSSRSRSVTPTKTFVLTEQETPTPSDNCDRNSPSPFPFDLAVPRNSFSCEVRPPDTPQSPQSLESTTFNTKLFARKKRFKKRKVKSRSASNLLEVEDFGVGLNRSRSTECFLKNEVATTLNVPVVRVKDYSDGEEDVSSEETSETSKVLCEAAKILRKESGSGLD